MYSCDWDVLLEVCSPAPQADWISSEGAGSGESRGQFGQRWVVNRRFAKLQWQDTTRRGWSNTTAGWWDLERLQSGELGQPEQRSTCVCEPPTDGREVLCRCVFAWMSATLCMWVAVPGSQRGQLAVAGWGRCHRTRRSRLFRFGGVTDSSSQPESARREHQSAVVSAESDYMFMILLRLAVSLGFERRLVFKDSEATETQVFDMK